MIIYKPTGQVFQNRKEAKIHFGTGLFNRLFKFTEDFIITNNPTSANYEVYSNSKEVPGTERRN
jgi:hypothetical protein